jgi:hypothetical protein
VFDISPYDQETCLYQITYSIMYQRVGEESWSAAPEWLTIVDTQVTMEPPEWSEGFYRLKVVPTVLNRDTQPAVDDHVIELEIICSESVKRTVEYVGVDWIGTVTMTYTPVSFDGIFGFYQYPNGIDCGLEVETVLYKNELMDLILTN